MTIATMTIAVDCRMIDASGIGVYLQGILPLLLQTEHKFLLFGNLGKLQPYSSLNKNGTIIPCDVKPFSIKELFFFPRKTLKKINKADIFYSPFFNIPPVRIPVFSTIHDIIFPDMPDITSKTGLAARMFFFRRAAKKSQKIFTVSEFSKSRIEYRLGKNKPVIVTHSAIQPLFLDYHLKIGNIQKKETVIFIGNIKKHKGLDYLIDAFSLAKKEGLHHKLIIIGEKENFRTGDNKVLQKIESLGNDTVLFTGFVSTEQLMEHLCTASLLIQPSLYEGFCLPPLEAMVIGTQALISDIAVLKEIYAGYPVTFFRTGDIIDLKEKMMHLLKSPASPELTCELLYRYTFEKTVSRILKELE